jgi:hydrogenase 3 maturation protease
VWFLLARKRFDLRKELESWLSDVGRVVVAGIGNPMRMDDFVGIRIVQNLRGRVSERVHLIECETVPESFIEQIADFDPSHVLLIDAAMLNLEPGDTRFIEPERLTFSPTLSTHMLPLRIFCECVTEITRAKIALLLIQPKEAEFGEGLTPEVKASSRTIAQDLCKLLP